MKTSQLAASLILGLTMAGQLLVAAPPERTAVHTNKTKFRIPFKFNPADLKALGAKQIILYVSTDRGTSWQQAQSVNPEAAKFNFQAPQDGEYWFVVRTLDHKNRLLPDSKVVDPELMVVVDTQKPTLKLELRQSSAGRVLLRWQASDDNLDPTQLRLEYSQPGIDAWQNVSIVPKASGQTEWTVAGSGIVAVRGIVSDHAKNTGQDQATLRISGSKTSSPPPDFSEPVAQDRGGYRASLPLPVQNTARFVPALRGDARSSFTSMRTEMPAPPAAGDGEPLETLIGNKFRVVPSAEFNIGYKIQDVGPSGVGAVELWSTRDNGTTWEKFAEDNDAQSPISVRMPHEGTYGFAFVIRSGVGLAGEPPQPGDRPEIVIAVDQTAPKIELLPLEQGRGSQMNKILVQWRYEDDYPGDKPVALSYAADPSGPWTSISGWVENTGRYVWTIGRNTPPRFYVRVEARDAAGNVNVAETPEPVLIDLSRPTAKVVDVQTP